MLKIVQIIQQLARRGVSLVAIFCQALLNQIIMRGSQLGIDAAGRCRFFINNLEHHRGGVAGKGLLPRENRENHDAQGEDVCPRINLSSTHLFR